MPEYDSQAINVARDYYNSSDADNFYFHVWGGEDLHLGIYLHEDDTIFTASRRTVDRMAAKLDGLGRGTGVIDVGGGYGGSMRRVVKNHACNAVVLNLSETENQRDRAMNAQQGVADRIDVVDGAFENLPHDDASFEFAWSEDAILHSPDRQKVLREVHRVLKPGGQFVFTDPMQTDDCPEGVLDPIYKRINLQSLASPGFYRQAAQAVGFEVSSYEDLAIHLPRHYQAVHDEMVRRDAQISPLVSRAYLDNMKVGLEHWVNGGRSGYLTWGMFHLVKRA
jgi:sarcosine/dimethylglycine N-methyltransferase